MGYIYIQNNIYLYKNVFQNFSISFSVDILWGGMHGQIKSHNAWGQAEEGVNGLIALRIILFPIYRFHKKHNVGGKILAGRTFLFPLMI